MKINIIWFINGLSFISKVMDKSKDKTTGHEEEMFVKV
jgi:hypothetical protein